jgi:hypothetical protein
VRHCAIAVSDAMRVYVNTSQAFLDELLKYSGYRDLVDEFARGDAKVGGGGGGLCCR